MTTPVAKGSLGLTGRVASKWADEPGNGPKMFIECGMSCPADSTLPGNVDAINFIMAGGSFLLDTNTSYKFVAMTGVDAEVYLNIRNVLNRAPNLNVPSLHPHSFAQTICSDDALGRNFRLDLRLKM